MFVFMGMRAGCISQTVKNFKPGEADHNAIFRSHSGPNSVVKLVAFPVLMAASVFQAAKRAFVKVLLAFALYVSMLTLTVDGG